MIVVSFTRSRLLEQHAAVGVAQELRALTRKHRRVLIDFSGLKGVGSAILSRFISLNSRVRKKGGQLKMCGMAGTVKDAVVLMNLDKLFDIHKTAAQALASFR